MASLWDHVRADWKSARLAGRDKDRIGALTSLVGELESKRKSLPSNRPWTDLDSVAVVEKQLSGVVTTLEALAGRGDRPDDVAKATAERAMLEAYVAIYKPQQMDEAGLEAFAVARKAEGLDMGRIMAALKAQHPGGYDGRLASTVVKRVLA